MLLAAGRALVDVAPGERPRLALTTSPAAEPVRPALAEQIVATGLVGAEPGDERRQVLRQIVRQHAKPSRSARLPPLYCIPTIDQLEPDAHRELVSLNGQKAVSTHAARASPIPSKSAASITPIRDKLMGTSSQ